jgi:hypothetical protein
MADDVPDALGEYQPLAGHPGQAYYIASNRGRLLLDEWYKYERLAMPSPTQSYREDALALKTLGLILLDKLK